MVLIEYYQSRGPLLRALAVLLLAALALRIWMGFFGVVLAIMVMIPNMAVGLGLGTFQEEISKDQLRFLYSMPIRWSSVWWYKLASAAVGIALMSGMIAGVVIIGNESSMDFLPANLQERVRAEGLWPIAGLGVLCSMVTYVIGLFTILMSRSVKLAHVIAFAIIYLPLIVLVLLCMRFGLVPNTFAVSAMGVCGSLVLMAGALVLFLKRNPLDDRVWRDRGIALSFLMLSAAAFAGAGLAADTMGISFRRLDRVPTHFSVSPDGGHLGITLHDGISYFGLVIDRDGLPVYELGRGVVPINDDALGWRPGSTQLLCEPKSWVDVYTPLNDNSPLHERRKLADYATGRMTELSIEMTGNNGHTPYFQQWSSDGRWLLAKESFADPNQDDEDPRYLWINQMILYDVDAREGRLLPLHDATDVIRVHQMIGDYVFLSNGYGYGMYDSSGDDRAWIERVHLPTLQSQRLTMPDNLLMWELNDTGDRVLAVDSQLQGMSVGYRLLEYSFGEIEPRVLLNRDQLPRRDVRDLVQGPTGRHDIEADYLPGGGWIQVTTSADEQSGASDGLGGYGGEEKVRFIINAHTGERLQGADGGGLMYQDFRLDISPDSSVWCTTQFEGGRGGISSDSDEIEVPRTTRFIFYPAGRPEDATVEKQLPGHAGRIRWLDNNTIVFILYPHNSWGGSSSTPQLPILRMDVTTGELYRLYPDPGPVQVDDLRPAPNPSLTTR